MKSPAHQKWPNHNVRESSVPNKIKAEIDGQVLAESDHIIKVEEDGHPTRNYFPRSDVRMENLERSTTTSVCPFKGTAHYFDINVNGKKYKDAVWTYEDPYEEHQALKGHLAFYEERIPNLRVASVN